jgi:hypothetical protein
VDKNIALAITYMYPNLIPFVDFKVVSENGNQSIAEWNVTEPEPTQDRLDDAWMHYLASLNPLDDLKKAKIDELDNECKNAILSNFTATLNGTEYEFNYDSTAQSQFNGVGVLFLGGQITQVDWTAYQNGVRTRITLTKDDFNIVSLAALTHQNTNVSKYNDLYNKVMTATTEDEVNQIKW